MKKSMLLAMCLSVSLLGVSEKANSASDASISQLPTLQNIEDEGSTKTEFGSGNTKSYWTSDGTTITFVINHQGDLANFTVETNTTNGKNLVFKTAEGVTLTTEDLAKVPNMTYNAQNNVYDFSGATFAEGVKLSTSLVAYNDKMTFKGLVLPLNYGEAASEFNTSITFVAYIDGQTAKVNVTNGGVANATSYISACTSVTLTGSANEQSLDLTTLSNLSTLDISGLTLTESKATVKVPTSISKVIVASDMAKSRILNSDGTALDEGKIEQKAATVPNYVKNGHQLTIDLKGDAVLSDIIQAAGMDYISNLTITTSGDRKLTATDITTINGLTFKHTDEQYTDAANITQTALWQDCTLNLEGCAIDDANILKNLENNEKITTTGEGDDAVTTVTAQGIRNIILPQGLKKTVVCKATFEKLTNLNAAISFAENYSSIVAYVATPGSLSTTLYQHPVLRPNINTNTRTAKVNIDGEEKSLSTVFKSATLTGTLLPADIANGLTANDNYLDNDGHLVYSATGEGGSTAIAYDGEKATQKFSDGTSGDQRFIPAFVGITLTNLDLSDAVFTSALDMNFSLLGILATDATQTTTVSLPTAESMTTIPAQCFHGVQSLKEICIPYNYTTIGRDAFHTTNLTHIYTTRGGDDSEETVVDYGENTYTFSSNLQSIGGGAIWSNSSKNVTDVYVLAKTAPKCEKNAFTTGMYYGWGGFKGNLTHPVSREMYANNSIKFTILHYPNGLTSDEASKYTDITKEYTLFDETGATDGNGNTLQWPNMSEFYRSYAQAFLGYTWDAWVKARELNDPNNLNQIYQGPDNNNGSVSGPVPEDKIADAAKTYSSDYTGWHQFVLTAAVNIVDPETPRHNFSGISDNNWWTLCVFFDMTKKEVGEFFGSKTNDGDTKAPIVTQLSNVERNAATNTITLKFEKDLYATATSEDAKVIEAGKAYLIRPYMSDEDIAACNTPSGHVFSSKNITGSMADVAKELSTKATTLVAKDASNNEITDYKYTMTGRFVDDDVPSNAYFLGWEGDAQTGYVTFYYQNSEYAKTWNAFTCVIGHNMKFDATTTASGNTTLKMTCDNDGFENTSASEGAKINLMFGSDDEATAINSLNGQTVNTVAKVYNANGQYVGQSLNGLAKGLYIVNGKKYVVK